MRAAVGGQVLLRIYIGESDRWHHQPLADALVEHLRRAGFAGATVLHAIAGFGARSVLHEAHLFRLSEDRPVVIEVVDSEEAIERLLPVLDAMIPDGLVTMERVQVVRYVHSVVRTE